MLSILMSSVLASKYSLRLRSCYADLGHTDAPRARQEYNRGNRTYKLDDPPEVCLQRSYCYERPV